jgi:uncharacterized membrane protein
LDKETATVALALATTLAVLAAVYPILPSNNQPFSELGVLGPNQKIGGYPTNVTAGQQISLYGYVGNHEGVASYYQFLVKLGNQSTVVSNSTAATAPVVLTTYEVLANNQTVTFPLTIVLHQPGTNERLIFELWKFDVGTSKFGYTGLYAQLWLNVTRT